jgi:integrase
VQVRVRGFPPQTATFARKTDAKRWAEQTEAAIHEGRYFTTNEARRHTLGDIIDRYLARLEKTRAHAHSKQLQLLGWWKKRLGPYALAHITPAIIAKERDALLNENIGTSKQPRFRMPSTANRYLAALSKLFSVAVKEWHVTPDNPVRRIGKGQESPGRVRYLSGDERERLLAACRSSALAPLELIVLLAISTGMRRGEIQGLRWADVDFGRSLIVLHKTKNRERRAVPIASAVRILLEHHSEVRRPKTEYVFSHATEDRPLDFDGAFRVAADSAELTDFRFHDLRHTAASYLAMSGATTAEIAAVLGHKTLAMVKRYAHLSEQHTSAVVERMTSKFLS